MSLKQSHDLIEALESRLMLPLPGVDAHRLMMPLHRMKYSIDQEKIKSARLGGVLIALYLKDGEWHIPLTLRHDYGGVHSGQISFPGGKMEVTDPNIEFTALREAQEEVGIAPDHVKLLGALSSLYVPVSNFNVVPTVSFIEIEPRFVMDSYEVKELIEVPLSLLLSNATIKHKDLLVGNNVLKEVPYFDVFDKVVWGATAMMLSEFIAVVRDSGATV
ncbi:CoA pyrophosphatase [Fulvivirga sp. M361]|uniref:NUDIX hydrolase n=1 Tax=Fulvivirga sp. M361 TaxID=2594266 RepID=UPI00117AC7AD|nr:CoA pyrophosphatase [Fulvivirga sp. M361]TRX50007.1 CoA pyrophosphatase [Fulvivirga sp. M361]